MARYVGFKIGKVHEEHVFSEYYCGGCGFPVTDHDSFCPECGGAFRESDADDDENAKLRYKVHVLEGGNKSLKILYDSVKANNAELREMCRDMFTTISWCNLDCYPSDNKKREYVDRLRELGIEVDE